MSFFGGWPNTHAKTVRRTAGFVGGVVERGVMLIGVVADNANASRQQNAPTLVVSLDSVSHEQRLRRVLLGGLPLSLLCAWGLALYAHDLDGPIFLILYFFAGIGSLLVGNVIRWNYVDSFYVSTVAATFFIMLAALRYADASGQGMHDFGVMIAFMVVGFFLFFIRREKEDGRTTLFGSCAGGGGGCGGDCGGGGCGGCGG